MCTRILAENQKYEDPYIIVGGDFNRRDHTRATLDHPDLKPVETKPTRGQLVLDIISTNMKDMVVDKGTADPIENQAEIATGHRTVFMTLRMPRVPSYNVTEFTYYHYTEAGNKAFGEWLSKQNWTGILDTNDVNQQVEKLHGLFQEATEASYQKKMRHKKSSEPTWMTEGMRT